MNRNLLVYRFLKKIENPDGNFFFGLINNLMCISLALYGKRVKRNISKNFPKHTVVLLPSRSAGDMHFLKYLFNELLEAGQIKNYLLVVDAASCYKCAMSLGYQNVYPVSMIKQKALMMYHRVNLETDVGIVNCYPWCMFDLNKAVRATVVDRENEQCIAGSESQAEKYGIIPRKTVIISPYENTISALGLSKLPVSFWADLVAKLQLKGYKVFTNCNGTKSEPMIEGTERIFPKFSEIRGIVDIAGNCISVRSGFVDFISQSTANKVILYPTEQFMECWSVYRTNIVENCREIVYTAYADDYTKLINEICNSF